MHYLDQFEKHLTRHDYPSFLVLWEEYCLGDEVDAEELKRILDKVRESPLAKPFGRHVENGLMLWEKIQGTEPGNEILKLIIDLQTTNDSKFADLAMIHLKEQYPNDPHFNDKIRLVGLREQVNFQGAIRSYELLTHMKKGNFVFHSGGWGAGEITDVSFLREQLTLEFDFVPGTKDLSFQNAFKTLIPIPNDHFLALRFGNPDLLEENAKKNPLEVIHTLLRDLGPSSAADIKDELCELVIPAEEWARWWQTTRSKIKKDTMIETPASLSQPFQLRESEVTHEERLQKALEKKLSPAELIQMIYTFLRDFPGTLKNAPFKKELEEKLQNALSTEELNDAEELQIHFFLQDLTSEKKYTTVSNLIQRFSSPEDVLNQIEIVAFKKRMLIEMRKERKGWEEIFLKLMLLVEQNTIRDYILDELLKAKKEPEITDKLNELLAFPNRNPNALLWYFQKVMKKSSLPCSDRDGKNRFFESFLILLRLLEQSSGHRDLIKKMHTFLTTGRYNNVRKIFKDADEPTVHEFLLLSTKCQSFSDQDIKILHSLAEVVHPSLGKLTKKYEKKEEEEEPIWTTQEGYNKTKERLQHISTVETVKNAKEIEAARALGDLRENAEFKAALERRDRLQSELKSLSSQFSQARILTKEDISTNKVSVGVIVDFENNQGEKTSYTLLGPWEADPDQNILSFQSKFAQALIGHKIGDKIEIQGNQYTISGLRNYLDTI